jgi:hypothetical protein
MGGGKPAARRSSARLVSWGNFAFDSSLKVLSLVLDDRHRPCSPLARSSVPFSVGAPHNRRRTAENSTRWAAVASASQTATTVNNWIL